MIGRKPQSNRSRRPPPKSKLFPFPNLTSVAPGQGSNSSHLRASRQREDGLVSRAVDSSSTEDIQMLEIGSRIARMRGGTSPAWSCKLPPPPEVPSPCLTRGYTFSANPNLGVPGALTLYVSLLLPSRCSSTFITCFIYSFVSISFILSTSALVSTLALTHSVFRPSIAPFSSIVQNRP
jgi:hypothetical protein